MVIFILTRVHHLAVVVKVSFDDPSEASSTLPGSTSTRSMHSATAKHGHSKPTIASTPELSTLEENSSSINNMEQIRYIMLFDSREITENPRLKARIDEEFYAVWSNITAGTSSAIEKWHEMARPAIGLTKLKSGSSTRI